MSNFYLFYEIVNMCKVLNFIRIFVFHSKKERWTFLAILLTNLLRLCTQNFTLKQISNIFHLKKSFNQKCKVLITDKKIKR